VPAIETFRTLILGGLARSRWREEPPDADTDLFIGLLVGHSRQPYIKIAGLLIKGTWILGQAITVHIPEKWNQAEEADNILKASTI